MNSYQRHLRQKYLGAISKGMTLDIDDPKVAAKRERTIKVVATHFCESSNNATPILRTHERPWADSERIVLKETKILLNINVIKNNIEING